MPHEERGFGYKINKISWSLTPFWFVSLDIEIENTVNCFFMLQDVITMIAEKGCQYTFQEYTELVKLHHRSHPALSPSQLEQRMQKLKEVIFKTPNGEHTPWQTL